MLMFGNKPNTLTKALPLIYIIGGTVALMFSLLITTEKAQLTANPGYVPPCNISPFISCGTVILTPQASVFGFPNSLMGIAGFAALITIGVVLLAGAALPRWFWRGLQIGATLAAVFVYWLFFQSVYRIGTLCPYCMGVWAMTIPIFWYTTVYNLCQGHLPMPAWLGGAAGFLTRHHGLMLTVLFLVIVVAILTRFWFYWVTLV